MKKALSLFLSLIMVLTVFTVALPTAFAEGEAASQMKYVGSAEAYNKFKPVITDVKFVNTLEEAPAEGYVWDVSAANDGSVKAWLTDVDATETDDGNGNVVTVVSSAKLVIGADGKIKLPQDMGAMFEGFSAASSIDFGADVDTSDVYNMEKLFDGCVALKTIDISAFDTADVQSFSEMFEGCSSIEALDLSALEINSAVTLRRMMKNCSSLKTVRIDNWYFGEQLTDMSELFEGCEGLSEVYIYDVGYHGDSKPAQNNVYYGVNTAELKFHDNLNIGTDSVLWERFFDDAKGATLVFDKPENYEVMLSTTSLKMLIGQTATVTATVFPRPENSEIKWTSDRNDIATVKGGVITAVGEGTAKITVTNKTVDEDGPKLNSAVLTVVVDKPSSDDCFKVTFEKPDSIEYFHVSYNGGDTYRPVYGGTFEYLKGTTIIVKAYGNAISYIFSVNGKEFESEENNRLELEVNADKTVSVRAVDLPSGEDTLSIFEKIAQWFRDLFEKLFGWLM